jgi:hypothetical protein
MHQGIGQSQAASMEVLGPLMQERLEAGQSVRFSPRGVSMLPMLRQGRDSVVLSPLPEQLKRYDIPLYRRADGSYILHRIVETGDTFTCLGDNQFVSEPGVTRAQMIGIVSGFYREDRFHPVTERRYQLYCRIWYHSRHLRRFLRRAIGWLRRHVR